MGTVIPFLTSFEPRYGEVERLSPLVSRVLANNPGNLTAWGTGTYLLGRQELAVIDPGPDLPEHLAALQRAIGKRTVTHIIITHPHADHDGLTKAFGHWCGAPIHSYDQSAAADLRPIKEGDVLSGKDWRLEAIHTPGHASAHLCFALAEEQTIFTGDHIMGWSTSVISPQDGDLAAYMDSLEKIRARPEQLYRPTHGPEIPNGSEFASYLLKHRQERTEQICVALAGGPAMVEDLVARIYTGLNPALKIAAGASVQAHLHALEREGKVRRDDRAFFELV